MSTLHKALAYSVFSKYINRAINLASIVFIARMLTPNEMGVFAIASAIVLLASELKSFGASGFLIREKNLDVPMVKKALGISVIISWSTGLILVLGSWQIATFYQQPDITLLLQFLAISFLLSPHIGVAKALMARDFLFQRIFIAETSSQIAQTLAVIYFIWSGHSYFSLAYSTAIGYLVELIVVLKFKPTLFVSLPLFTGLKSMMKFGLYVSFGNLCRKMTVTLPDLIIGRRGTSAEVAYFSRGTGFLSFLTMTINSGIRPVVAPFLAKKQREGHDLEQPYLNASLLLGGLVVPVLAVAGYASDPVIDLFFGDQWSTSASLVSILCFWSIIRFFHTLNPALFITAGFEKILFYKELFVFSITGIVIYVLYSDNLHIMAYGMVGTAAIDFVLISFMLQRKFNIALLKQIANLLPNIFLACICVIWAYLLDQFIPFKSSPSWLVIAILAPTTGVVWFASILLTKHQLSNELQTILRKLRKQ